MSEALGSRILLKEERTSEGRTALEAPPEARASWNREPLSPSFDEAQGNDQPILCRNACNFGNGARDAAQSITS